MIPYVNIDEKGKIKYFHIMSISFVGYFRYFQESVKI